MNARTLVSATLIQAAIGAIALVPRDSDATHQLFLGSQTHHFQPTTGSVTLVGQYGTEGGHLPSYDLRAYAYSAGFYTPGLSPLSNINASAKHGVSCRLWLNS
jgi:hypothetical protein